MDPEELLRLALENSPTNYRNIPESLVEGLKRYVDIGCPVGDFLQAVISNDLLEAFKRADEDSMRAMPAIAAFVYNDMPGPCHGSRRVYNAWLALYDGQRNEVDDEKLQELADEVSEARNEVLRWRGHR